VRCCYQTLTYDEPSRTGKPLSIAVDYTRDTRRRLGLPLRGAVSGNAVHKAGDAPTVPTNTSPGRRFGCGLDYFRKEGAKLVPPPDRR